MLGPKHATNMETEHQTQVNTPDDPMNPIYGSVPRSLPTSYLDEMAPPPLGIFGELPTSVDEMDWVSHDSSYKFHTWSSQFPAKTKHIYAQTLSIIGSLSMGP